jgi:hypothetical protein
MLENLSPATLTRVGLVAGVIGLVSWLNGIDEQQGISGSFLIVAAIVISAGTLGREISNASRHNSDN